MLDLSHPQTMHIFLAARLQDEIRTCLVAAIQAKRRLREVDTVRVLLILEQLDSLNSEHFGADVGIASTLERLRDSVRGGDTEIMWSRFLELADTPGKNFGTWAI